MPATFLALSPRDRDGAVRVVVESPAGSRVKLEYAADRMIDRSRRFR